MDDLILYSWIFGPPMVLLGVLALSHYLKRRRAKRLTEFARTRGWLCTHSWGLTGPGKRYTIRPETGGDWELCVRRSSSAGYHAHHPGRTEFRSAVPRFPGEFVIFTETGGFTRGFGVIAAVFRVVGRVLGRTVAGWIYGRELGENLPCLRPFEAPAGIELGIFATSDPREQFDLEAISRGIYNMSDGRRLRPAIQIGDGLQVVLQHEAAFPGIGEDFLAGCIELRARLLGNASANHKTKADQPANCDGLM